MPFQRTTLLTVGQRIGRFTVLDPDRYRLTSTGNRRRAVLVQCECGTVCEKDLAHVATGHTQSCGCWQRVHLSKGNPTHHGSASRLYGIWNAMLTRCNNPNGRFYHRYGGRGIRVCHEWESFPTFRDWALTHGYHDDLSIERVNNDAGYSPTNCTWIPRSRQPANTCRNRRITAFGETKTLAEWERDPRCVVRRETLSKRLLLGWTTEDGITRPVRRRNSQRCLS
jgi:hypothetical protein